jgi:polyferredoxin
MSEEEIAHFKGRSYTEEEIDAILARCFKTAFGVSIAALTFYNVAVGNYWTAYGTIAGAVVVYYFVKGMFLLMLIGDLDDEDDEKEDEEE